MSSTSETGPPPLTRPRAGAGPLWTRAALTLGATALLAGLAVALGWPAAFGPHPSALMIGLLALLGLSGVLALALLLRLRRSLFEPLRAVCVAAERTRPGEAPVRAPVLDSDDEAGRLTRAFNAMLDRLDQDSTGRNKEDTERLERGVVQLLEIVSSAAEGDLTARGEITHDELGSVTDALNHMLESIGRLVLEVRRSGMAVSTAAERILTLSESMASGAAKQSIVLNLVTKKIRALGERSLEINQIVELIDEISSQTNMLALNAAIEAAKAGEQGKGFAVVANEVRKLAERTSSATKDIGAFIQSIQAATEGAVVAMEEIRSETRSTADGALDTTRAADEMVEAARQLGMTIGRFKVHRRNADELARALESRRAEMRSNLKALLDLADVAAAAGPSSRIAAEMLLEDLEELTSYAHQRIRRPHLEEQQPGSSQEPAAETSAPGGVDEPEPTS